jgi:hypothetical protein
VHSLLHAFPYRLPVGRRKKDRPTCYSEKWKATDLFIFKELMNDIYKNWVKITADRPFPKLHMLRHAVEFAQRHEILGAASESQIESFHFAFNHLYHFQHRNTLHEPLEQLGRCLADPFSSLVVLLLPAPHSDGCASAGCDRRAWKA